MTTKRSWAGPPGDSAARPGLRETLSDSSSSVDETAIRNPNSANAALQPSKLPMVRVWRWGHKAMLRWLDETCSSSNTSMLKATGSGWQVSRARLYVAPATWRMSTYRHARHMSTGAAGREARHERPHARAEVQGKFQGRTGLFGIKGLERPQDFPKQAQEAADKIANLRERVISGRAEMAAKQMLILMDEISDSLCLVIDAAELCRSVHADSAWKENAMLAYEMLGDVISQLNSDEQLYRALDVCVKHRVGADFNEEDKRMAWSLREDFERGGVHLDEAGRQEVIELQARASALLYEFTCDQYDEAEPSLVIPAHLADVLPTWMKRTMTSDGATAVNLSQDSLQALLQVIPDEEVRKAAYLSYHQHQPRVRTLEQLLHVRQLIAHKMNFSSFADYAISGKMAASPRIVEDFLHHLSDQLKPRARQEVEILKKQKQHYQALEDGSSHEIFPWDFPFYSLVARSPQHELACKLIRNFLPLSRVLQGIGMLLENTFGISMRAVELGEGEGWSTEVKKFELTLSESLNDEQVLKFPTDDKGLLGILYLDLIKRPGKFGGAAHFTIQCGRMMEDGQYRPPVLALVGNFSPPAQLQEPLLSFGELEMLLHEFGHALHSIVGRTRYQVLRACQEDVDSKHSISAEQEYRWTLWKSLQL
eukprot:762930-Hanusia_phi.AAC.10